MTCPSLLRPLPAAAALDAAAEQRRITASWVRQRMTGDDASAQLVRFAMVGGLASAVHVGLFVTLASLGDLSANLVGAVVSSALANELHRRRTFRAGGRVSWVTAQWEGGGLAVVGAAITSGALALLAATSSGAPVAAQAMLVIAVTSTVGIARFVALRWAFHLRAIQPA